MSSHPLRTRVRLALALLAAALLLSLAPQGTASGHEVLVLHVEGVVTRGTLLHIEDGIEEAESRGVPLVIQLDTPGGLVDATLEIHKRIVRADVPVLTFVGPEGAFAASAGTFILLMGHPSGMAPSTQIGSAQPIQSSPTGGTENASAKVENFLVERMREIAERTGRNETLATRFITENLNMDEDEALRTGLVEAVSDDVEAFVRAMDGERALVGASGEVTLRTADARIVELDKGLLARTVEILGNPQIAFILFLAGLYGVIFGLASPGTFVPETIGALLLLLGLIGLGLFDTSTAGLLLFLLAGVFFVAEVFTPTHGVLTALGVVSLLFAAVFLIDEPLLPASFLRQFLVVGLVSAAVSGAVVFGALTLALRARKRPVSGDVVGEAARALGPLDPEGQVWLHGEIWRAVAEEGPIEADADVVVVAREGLTVRVRRVPQASGETTE